MSDDKIVLYMHAGSGNHGCEAIVNGLCELLPKPAILISNRPEEDRRYSLGSLCGEITEERKIEKYVPVHAWYYLYRKLFRDPESFMRYRYSAVTGKNAKRLNISIGGDNYCYENMLDRLILANRMFHRQGGKTVLYGCSIEPELLARPEILEDMKRYDAIVARETITYKALLAAGLRDSVRLCPDPAFLMEARERPLPKGWAEGKMVGINISPMIQSHESRPGLALESYRCLIRHILDTTDLCVALIPHVVWENNDDRIPLEELYQMFMSTGRVVRLEDGCAPQLKGDIGRCRMFIGARTHATIAAYSSCVPTLAVGYSVKARGIAKDLFGTDQNYVLPVQRLEKKEDLAEAFQWLLEHEGEVRGRLTKVMPKYLEMARQGGELLRGM